MYAVIQWRDDNAFITACDANDGAGGFVGTFSTEPATGDWFYAAMTGDPSTGITGRWWNAAGVLQDTAIANPTATWNEIPDTISLLTNNFSEHTDGVVSYGRLWDASLTQAELELEMFSPGIVRTANINSAFTGVNGSGVDVSGNGRNWTLTGTGTSTDEPPVRVSCMGTYRQYGHLLVR
jgi:hypothetical protein